MKKYLEKRISDSISFTGYSPVESALLDFNGITDLNEIQSKFPDLFKRSWLNKFIEGELTSIQGAKDFANFISNNKHLSYVIVGDYDADGIMATTIMKLALQTFGVSNVSHIIPNRLEDGYGIRIKQIDYAINLGGDVIITVDNGITANEAIDYAKQNDIRVIVTDHHLPNMENLPNADLIINPQLSNEIQKEICGAFVAFKLALTLLDLKNKDHEYAIRDMALFAAVATIADVMPMVGENRQLVRYVLDTVNFIKEKNFWAGRTLKFLSGFGGHYLLKNEELIITEETLGFYISPAINATGRIQGDVNHVVDDIINSVEYGAFINGYKEINNERKTKTAELFKTYQKDDEPIGFVVLDKDNYDYSVEGLVGLVANRISSNEQKPAFVGIEKNGKLSFSSRSVPGYSVYDGLQRFFQKYPKTTVEGGGHSGAIGFRMTDYDEVELLKEHFTGDYKEYGTDVEEVVFYYESDIVSEIFEAHKKFAPFGEKFSKLSFIIEGKITNVDKTQYLIEIDGVVMKSFNKAHMSRSIGEKVRVVFSPSLDNKFYDDFKVEELVVLGGE